jgi:hypothetical protein
MSFSPRLKWLIVLLLPLTVTWKLSAQLGDSYSVTDVRDKIVEFFLRQQFEAVTDATTVDIPIVRVTAGGCRMLVVSTSGWTPDTFRDLATPSDHLYLIFRGKVYAEELTWLPLLNRKWFRFLRRLKLTTQQASLIVVLAGGLCEVQRLPWEELREL